MTGSSNRLVRRHDPQYPANYQPPTPARLLAEQRIAVLQQAADEGWGEITGEVVLGDRIIFSFENGAQLPVQLPPGSKTDGPDVPRPEPLYGYTVEPALPTANYMVGQGDLDRMEAERQASGQPLPWETGEQDD